MKFVVKGSLILILTGLFIYQSWRTIRKYQAKNTSLQVTMRDEGSILFPSITICKDEMYNNRLGGGLFTRLNSGGLLVEDAGAWFRNRTVSRSELVKLLSISTVDPSNNYPCNTVSGKRGGEACSFPFIYPDCKQQNPPYKCQEEGVEPLLYMNCTTIGKASYC